MTYKNENTSKHCTRCNTTKLAHQFGRNKGRSDGLSVWCRACNTAYQKAHREVINRKVAIFDRAQEIIEAKRALNK